MMRLRQERRIRKQLRRFWKSYDELPLEVANLERKGMTLLDALQAIVLNPKAGWIRRGLAARLLGIADPQKPLRLLLDQLRRQTEHIDTYETALAIEHLDDPGAVNPLIPILLHDPNEHRRQAAARALGWIRSRGNRVGIALSRCLGDPLQPHAAREEAAESLAYRDCLPARNTLIAAMDDSDVRIRFWSTFGIGGLSDRPRDPVVVAALERRLDDHEVTPGNWWSVSREAFAMLASMDSGYRERLEAEAKRILADPASTPEDRRWAEHYG